MQAVAFNTAGLNAAPLDTKWPGNESGGGRVGEREGGAYDPEEFTK
jgi:hypothetical protein